ncbi:MAG TPA: PatB family C-S lyase [Anaerolineae bacterium]|nr:PatB family C-S lyase [Anaerolineae bacterium]
MSYDFDCVIDRRSTESAKWHAYAQDVLPLWVADMDFACPEPVIQALRERVSHGVFGYPAEPPDLRCVIVDWMWRSYGWRVAPESLVFLPGIVVGFNLAIRAVANPGDDVLAQTPVYFPILWAPANAGCSLGTTELSHMPDGSYGVDMDAFVAAITPRTKVFVLCNPHNPVGRVFRRDELEAMALACRRSDLVICSDEIHCDLVYDGHHHLPVASLDPEIGQHTITLMAPSKTFNIAGLHSSFAVIENADLRKAFVKARAGLVSGVSVMGYAAMLAAYRDGRPWLDALLRYLQSNRDFLADTVASGLPGITMRKPEGTFLAWLDCRASLAPGNPKRFFLERARVALNGGASFGPGGEGFVRLNFGCPRATLAEALGRMANSLESQS